MWVPNAFRLDDPDARERLIEAHPFATVVATVAGAVRAVHIPLLLDSGRGENGTLVGHFARANPIAKAVEAGDELLVAFLGPHGYISPSWYEERNSVPTWNYVAIHAYGRPRAIDDPQRVEADLRRLVTRFEPPAPDGWSLESAGAETMARLIPALLPFDLPVDRWEAQFKLSQNRSDRERMTVIDRLERSGQTALAAWMRSVLYT